MSFVLYGGALSRLVVAHDCADANESSLTEAFAQKSEAEISSGLRWFYCAGLAIALASMGLISMSHVHKEVDGQRLKKKHRLAVRFAVAVAFLCLPLAKHLNSLTLISTTTGLVVLVYTVNCKMRKTDLEDAMKKGDPIKIEELAEKESGQQGLYEPS
ncbi:hypothetical protein GP486_004348 [Trichoglossum hirsutum]|uniref:Uncharacterized protein n=1 Tax=Trichoglossum hirsutum TaxID=265104 RepID=A0A9P8LBC3_9PEZI|nr:hypothetical protein GP486_004348 [Trichoglossum hirsutum]